MQIAKRSYGEMYEAMGRIEAKKQAQERESKRLRNALENSAICNSVEESSGFQRISACRRALEALDRRGWERSYHQRFFHDHFIRACSRVFWKVSTS
jgi:hypothetical protein